MSKQPKFGLGQTVITPLARATLTQEDVITASAATSWRLRGQCG